jgi:hypothetical protein
MQLEGLDRFENPMTEIEPAISGFYHNATTNCATATYKSNTT